MSNNLRGRGGSSTTVGIHHYICIIQLILFRIRELGHDIGAYEAYLRQSTNDIQGPSYTQSGNLGFRPSLVAQHTIGPRSGEGEAVRPTAQSQGGFQPNGQVSSPSPYAFSERNSEQGLYAVSPKGDEYRDTSSVRQPLSDQKEGSERGALPTGPRIDKSRPAFRSETRPVFENAEDRAGRDEPSEPPHPRRKAQGMEHLDTAFRRFSLTRETRPANLVEASNRRPSNAQPPLGQGDTTPFSPLSSVPPYRSRQQPRDQRSEIESVEPFEKPNYYKRNSSYRILKKEYTIWKGPEEKEFFVFGRVFETAIAEGSSVKSTVSSAGGGQLEYFQHKSGHRTKIHCKMRHLVVVRVKHGCSWCLLVHSYEGRGTAKPGLSQADQENYSILHMENTTPVRKPDEKHIIKEDIKVQPATQHGSLDPMSRLNFGKIYTIEHNVETRNIGLVTPASRVFLSKYFQAELISSMAQVLG